MMNEEVHFVLVPIPIAHRTRPLLYLLQYRVPRGPSPPGPARVNGTEAITAGGRAHRHVTRQAPSQGCTWVQFSIQFDNVGSLLSPRGCSPLMNVNMPPRLLTFELLVTNQIAVYVGMQLRVVPLQNNPSPAPSSSPC